MFSNVILVLPLIPLKLEFAHIYIICTLYLLVKPESHMSNTGISCDRVRRLGGPARRVLRRRRDGSGRQLHAELGSSLTRADMNRAQASNRIRFQQSTVPFRPNLDAPILVPAPQLGTIAFQLLIRERRCSRHVIPQPLCDTTGCPRSSAYMGDPAFWIVDHVYAQARRGIKFCSQLGKSPERSALQLGEECSYFSLISIHSALSS
jgi:hypothetical protein